MKGPTVDFRGPDEKICRVTVADGTSLFVKAMGSGPPVFVLHGGPGAHHDYLLPPFARLADEYRLYFYDQRGGGRSEVRHPTGVGWREHVADLEALRESLELHRPSLLGYSWGGLLALLYATEYPDRVRLLVLVDPAAAWGDYHQRFREEFERRSQSAVVRRMREELEASGLRARDPEAYRQRRFELSVAGYFRDPREGRELTPFRVQEQVRQSTWSSLRGHGTELRRRARDLEIPVGIFHGRYDPIPLEYAEELARLLPRAELTVMEESGHVPYVEEPDRLFQKIREYLREHIDHG